MQLFSLLNILVRVLKSVDSCNLTEHFNCKLLESFLLRLGTLEVRILHTFIFYSIVYINVIHEFWNHKNFDIESLSYVDLSWKFSFMLTILKIVSLSLQAINYIISSSKQIADNKNVVWPSRKFWPSFLYCFYLKF